jgi:hypothetical protein
VIRVVIEPGVFISALIGSRGGAHRARELWPVVYELMQWREPHLVDGGPLRLFSHAECGTTLTRDGRCPECSVEPEPADVETRPGPGAPPVLRDDASAAPCAGRTGS